MAYKIKVIKALKSFNYPSPNILLTAPILQITKWQSGSGSGGNPTWVAGVDITACSIAKQPVIDEYYSSPKKNCFNLIFDFLEVT
jgi:hypothetical protein